MQERLLNSTELCPYFRNGAQNYTCNNLWENKESYPNYWNHINELHIPAVGTQQAPDTGSFCCTRTDNHHSSSFGIILFHLRTIQLTKLLQWAFPYTLGSRAGGGSAAPAALAYGVSFHLPPVPQHPASSPQPATPRGDSWLSPYLPGHKETCRRATLLQRALRYAVTARSHLNTKPTSIWL